MTSQDRRKEVYVTLPFMDVRRFPPVLNKLVRRESSVQRRPLVPQLHCTTFPRSAGGSASPGLQPPPLSLQPPETRSLREEGVLAPSMGPRRPPVDTAALLQTCGNLSWSLT